MNRTYRPWIAVAAVAALAFGSIDPLEVSAQAPAAPATQAPSSSPPRRVRRPEFPKFSDVSEGYTKIASPDGKPTFYTIYKRDKDGQMLAELPRNYASQKQFIAMTLASGDSFAGYQEADMYFYWRRYDKRLALIRPNVAIRSSGDPESKSSVQRLFTDRVVLDVPILCMGPTGAPVIDMDALLVNQASRFFGSFVRVANPRLVKIKTAKAFPKNVELAFEVPVGGSSSLFSLLGGGGSGSKLQTLHYSISAIQPSRGYQPRKADQRVGYFVTYHNDYGQYKEDTTRVRYINRWHLKKRDASLALSPPEKPIVFYIEHTTPVRYRRWVRQGIEYWNKAFEKVGLLNAIEVRQQDRQTGTWMELDPEDVRYNFVRWLNNNIPTAIGPSRVHPETGEILDADIILTDGWIRVYLRDFKETLPKVAMEGFGPETLAWLDRHPNWDPRIRLAPPSMRDYLLAQRAQRGPLPYGGHPLASADPTMMGDNEYDGLVGRTSQINGMCTAAMSKAMSLAKVRMVLAMQEEEGEDKDEKEKKKNKKEEDKKKEEDGDAKKDNEKKDGEKQAEEEKKSDDDKKKQPTKPAKKKEQMLDGIPESFVGPMLADLVAHEVGHTLGLRHNFRASATYSLAEINSDDMKGKKPLAGSVMDYLPVNINMETGKIQGDYAMIDIGPYDMWAIEYGYTFDRNLKPILDRVAEPELQYATDEDTFGPDPLVRLWDIASDPLDYAKSQMELARHHRKHLVEKFVKDGESWDKARRGYEMTLFFQTDAVSIMGNWVGGSYVHRDKKGDKNGRAPISVVPAEKQRAALDFVIKSTFFDEVYGLTPELLKHMTVDKWLDGDSFTFALIEDPTWPVHDRIMGIQASTLTMLMNPTTLRRVYDNEFRVPDDTDMLTLPELLETLSAAIWSELETKPNGHYTARKPMISSLRRNLQREHMGRLLDLTKPDAGFTAAYKPIANLATLHLRRLSTNIAPLLNEGGDTKLDPYSMAHLSEAKLRIDKALDAVHIYNTNDLGGGGLGSILFFKQPQGDQGPNQLRQ